MTDWYLYDVIIDDRGQNYATDCSTDGCERDLSYHFTM
jgi:hypothetical protein